MWFRSTVIAIQEHNLFHSQLVFSWFQLLPALYHLSNSNNERTTMLRCWLPTMKTTLNWIFNIYISYLQTRCLAIKTTIIVAPLVSLKSQENGFEGCKQFQFHFGIHFEFLVWMNSRWKVPFTFLPDFARHITCVYVFCISNILLASTLNDVPANLWSIYYYVCEYWTRHIYPLTGICPIHA